MKKKIIHLIRHGKTDANTLKLIAGVTDRELNDEGIAELHELKAKGCYEDTVQFCFTSKQKRTIQTKQIAYPDVPWESDVRFNELDFGEYEDTNLEMRKDDPEYYRWITQNNEMLITAPGGEEISVVRKRLDDGLRDSLIKMDRMGISEYAIIGHGNLFAELTYVYLHDDRNVKTRMDTTFPTGLGIKVLGYLNENGEVILEYLEDIR